MKNKKLPVSVAMVVYNEEALIARALKSCADLVDDIVIVHDGPCKDRTLEIAKKFTNKIFIVKHIGAPEPQRPFSFSKTKNNWVLQLDADEYLDKDFRDQLPELIKKDIAGYTVDWVEEVKSKQFINMTKEVLFQKNRVFFIGAPMEYVKPINPKEKLVHASVGLVNAPKISNYGNWAKYTRKYGRIREIQAHVYAQPFSSLKNWNYKGKDWDGKTKLKIRYPLLFGVVGMNAKFLLEFFKKLTGQRTSASIASLLHQIWYNTTLYWQLYQIQQKNKRDSLTYSIG